ncbi:hypothetical protein [Streptomyces sp. NPDC058632]|uniref:hypothetical protein n=1 Tax=Streptomyces sp. NPDC058632 TaxID=3346567 RepID=UPI00366580EC
MPVAAAPPAPDRGDAPTVQGRLPAVLLMAGSCLLTVFGAVVLHPVPVEPAFLLDDPGVDSTGVIGVVTAVAGTATVLGSVLFTRSPTGRDAGCRPSSCCVPSASSSWAWPTACPCRSRGPW